MAPSCQGRKAGPEGHALQDSGPRKWAGRARLHGQQSRLLVAWGWRSKPGLTVHGGEGSHWGEGHVLTLHYGDHPTTQIAHPQSIVAPFKWGNFVLSKWYLKKAEQRKTHVAVTFEKHTAWRGVWRVSSRPAVSSWCPASSGRIAFPLQDWRSAFFPSCRKLAGASRLRQTLFIPSKLLPF